MASARSLYQVRISPQNPLVKLSQLGSGLGAEFLDQDPASALIGGKRLGLAAAPVERQHQQGMQMLAQRVGRDEALKFGDHLGLAAQVHVGVDACLQGLQPHLGQPGDFARCQHL